jgi:hypothetical protein
LTAKAVNIECCEHFVKQTYRSQCHILGANGRQTLSVPVVKNHGQKMPIRDVRIDYAEHWQQQHWRALTAAYNNSPFFEHYADELRPFYEKKEPFLFDFNYQLLQMLMKWMGLSVPFNFSTEYQKNIDDDFRYSISPKNAANQQNSDFTPLPYYQVFAPKFGFVPHLSVVDLLFNEGNNAQFIIHHSNILKK